MISCTLGTDTYTLSSTSSAMRKISKRSVIFPECPKISASASVTNSLCQSAEGLPGVEPVGWGWGAWTQNKQKIYSYIRLQIPACAWFLFYYYVSLSANYNFAVGTISKPFQIFPLFSLLLKSNTLLVLFFRHAAIYKHHIRQYSKPK